MNYFDADGRLMKKTGKLIEGGYDNAIQWSGWDSALWQNVTFATEGAAEGASTWVPGVVANKILAAIDHFIWHEQKIIDPQLLMMIQPELMAVNFSGVAAASLTTARGLISEAANYSLVASSDGKGLLMLADETGALFPQKNALVSATDLAKLRSAERDVDAFVGIINDEKISLFKSGENNILGHADLVSRGIATPGQTLGFSVGLDGNGVVQVINMSELNVHLGTGGTMPTSVFNAIKSSLGAK